jgi:hypothetical protein
VGRGAFDGGQHVAIVVGHVGRRDLHHRVNLHHKKTGCSDSISKQVQVDRNGDVQCPAAGRPR